jgi:small conductance mechanosensitive channel
MLKDVLVGVSILFENQFAVGDLIKIGDFTGTVISLGLKTTKLQAYTGEVKIISNRNITELINYSVDKTLAVVDLAVSYESKIEKVEKILLVAAATMKEKIDNLAGDIELLGVQELSDSAVIFRIVAKCKPAKHFEVERQLKKEFKNVLDKNGVKIPYTQIEVHNEK